MTRDFNRTSLGDSGGVAMVSWYSGEDVAAKGHRSHLANAQLHMKHFAAEDRQERLSANRSFVMRKKLIYGDEIGSSLVKGSLRN